VLYEYIYLNMFGTISWLLNLVNCISILFFGIWVVFFVYLVFILWSSKVQFCFIFLYCYLFPWECSVILRFVLVWPCAFLSSYPKRVIVLIACWYICLIWRYIKWLHSLKLNFLYILFFLFYIYIYVWDDVSIYLYCNIFL
jgi:hypothetical protein